MESPTIIIFGLVTEPGNTVPCPELLEDELLLAEELLLDEELLEEDELLEEELVAVLPDDELPVPRQPESIAIVNATDRKPE